MPKIVDMSDDELFAKADEALQQGEAALGKSKDPEAGTAFGCILDARGMVAALKARHDLKKVTDG